MESSFTYGDVVLTGFPAIMAMFIFLIIFLGVPIFLVVYFISHTSRYAHRKKSLNENTIIVEYEVPDKLTPAEVGYLFDSRFGENELVATLVDLEQKGLVSLERKSLTGLSVCARDVDLGTMNAHEKYIFDSVSGESSLFIISAKTIFGFKKKVRQSLADKGYINGKKKMIHYFAQRAIIAYAIITLPVYVWLSIFMGDGLIGFIIAWVLVYIFAFPFFFVIALVAGGIYNTIVGQPSMWSPMVKEIWPQLEGFRDYVEAVELDRLRFDSEDLKTASKNKALPYAIALNLNTEWLKRFS